MSSGAKRKTFSIYDKFCLIRDIENGSKISAVSKKYRLSSSTVSTIWKNREVIVSAFENNKSSCKKLKKCYKTDLDEALLAWVKKQTYSGLPLSGPILKAQGDKLAIELGYHGFTCTNSWIDRFKNRHSIIYARDRSDAVSIDLTLTSDWVKNVWPHIKMRYSDNEIYAADEMGIFYNLTPDKISKFKSKNCTDGEFAENRLTVFVCANMSGSDKRKLLVIGKSTEPTSFKNVKKLPVTYSGNKKAHMTSTIFQNEICKWDEILHRENKQILLLVDGCVAHCEIPELTNIELCFLPRELQPIDKDIIKSFKYYFRRSLVLQIISHREKFPKGTCDISLLDAIWLLSDAWNSVTSATIQNSFRKCGLGRHRVERDDCDDCLPLSEWLQARNISILGMCNDIDEFVNVDDNVLTCGVNTDDKMFNDFSSEHSSSNHNSKTPEACAPEIEKFNLTWEEAEKSLEMLTRFCESQTVCSDRTFNLLSELRNNFRSMKYTSKNHEMKADRYFTETRKKLIKR